MTEFIPVSPRNIVSTMRTWWQVTVVRNPGAIAAAIYRKNAENEVKHQSINKSINPVVDHLSKDYLEGRRLRHQHQYC